MNDAVRMGDTAHPAGLNTGRRPMNQYRREDLLLLWLLPALSFTLPLPFCLAMLLFVVLYPWLPPAWRARHRQIILAGLAVGIGLALLTLPNWLGGESLLAGVALVAVLKRAELQSPRDRLIFVVAVFLTNSLHLVYWNNLPALLHLLALMALILGLLWQKPAGSEASGRLTAMAVITWSLPLALVLFLFLPRIPGPLWDVGLAFGLPISVHQQTLALRSTPDNAGQNDVLAALQAQQQVVLVAEFAGAVPLKSNLYWRGAVSYGYHEGEWTDSLAGTRRTERLAAAWRDMARYQPLIKAHLPAVSYQIKVAPHQQHWLYAPDLPERNAQESYISADNQLLSIRPLHDEFSYRGSSFLEASFKPETAPAITPSDLPVADRAQIELTVNQWRQAVANSTEKALDPAEQSAHTPPVPKEQLLSLLASPPDWFDAGPPYSAERLQRWVGISMLLLQRAGLPARMVSGYRGGDLIALSNVVVVRQKHLHHWLEFWDSESGWQRLDIKDILQLQNASVAEVNEKPAAQTEPRNDASSQIQRESSRQSAKKAPVTPWLNPFEDWLQRYSPQTQVDMQSGDIGSAQGHSASLWIPGVCVVLWISLFLAYRSYRQRPPVMEQSWQHLRHVLSRQSFAIQDWQCPSVLLEQIQERQPAWGEAARRLIQTYLSYRYAQHPPVMLPATYRARVKRLDQALKNASVAKQPLSGQMEQNT